MSTDSDAAGPDGEYRLDEHGRPVPSVAETIEAATALVDGIAAGPGGEYRLNSRGRPVKSVAHTIEAATAMIEGLTARRRRPDAGMNDDFDLYELGLLMEHRAAAKRALDRTVVDLYARRGYSWGEIGRALGITRQAALQRWGAHAAALEPLEGLERG